MTTDQWPELARTLGIAAPLVLVLTYMLREATAERREITARFLTALQTTVEQSNEVRIRAATEMHELVVGLAQDRERGAAEHERMVQILEQLDGRLDAEDRRRS